MGLVEWARSPWGQDIPIHISFFLIWVSAIGGLLFLIGHAIWLKYFDTPDVFQPTPAAETVGVPPRVKRHSLAARLFHWVMAASMLTLLVTAFLPRVGVQFAWVTYHWIAGVVLTISILFHLVHATFFMDPWAIWPDKIDIQDAIKRFKRATGESGAAAAKVRQVSA